MFPILLIPILHFTFSYILIEICDSLFDSSNKIDNLHKISTYTPYLGDVGRIMDIANEYGILSDIERSQSTLAYIDTVANVVPIIFICVFIIIILSIIELGSILNWTIYTKKRLIILYTCISSLFILCSIYIDSAYSKLKIVLSGVMSNVDGKPTHMFFFITLFVTLLLYLFYHNVLNRLYFKSTKGTMTSLSRMEISRIYTIVSSRLRKKKVSLDIKEINDSNFDSNDKNQRDIDNEPQLDKNIISKKDKKNFHIKFIISTIFTISIIGMLLFFYNKENVRRNDDYNTTINYESDKTDSEIIEEKLKIQTADIPNQFEKIKRQEGNYQIDIDWPISLNKVSNIDNVHQAIINKTFNNEENIEFNHNIEDCIKHYFKMHEEDTIPSLYEKSGKIVIKYQQQFDNIHLFKIYKYADLGGGTGVSVISCSIYLYYDINLEKVLNPNDIFTDYSQALSIINEHISLDEYSHKAEEIPDNFILNNYGITFIFPQYTIGYGYQGNVKIEIPYYEIEFLISDNLIQSINLIKQLYRSEKKLYCKGDMAGFPIIMEISIDPDNNIVGKYTNVKYNVEFSLEGSYLEDEQTFNITATNETNKCFFKLKQTDMKTLTGVGISGDTELNVNLTVKN